MPKSDLEEMHSTLENFCTQIPSRANISKEELHEMVNIACAWLEENTSTPSMALDNLPSRLLHCAASLGYLELVQQLLQQKSSLLASTHGEVGITALHSAARMGHLEVVTWLLDYDTEKVAQFDSEGKNVLFYAALSKNLELLEWFLEHRKEDFSDEDEHGNTVLNDMASEGTLELFEWFMEHSPRELVNERGGLLLINCVYSEELKKVEYMVNYLKKNSVAPPSDILMRASEKESFDVFMYLADAYPDLLIFKDHNGCIPIHYYAEDGTRDEVMAIKEKVLEKFNLKIDDMPDNIGDTPFFKALKEGNFPVAKFLIEEGDINLGHKNKKHETAFHCCFDAYKQQKTKVTKKVLDFIEQFNEEAVFEEVDEEQLLSFVYPYIQSKDGKLEEVKKILYLKFPTWIDKIDLIKEQWLSNSNLMTKFSNYLFSAFKRSGLPMEGLNPLAQNKMETIRQAHLKQYETMFCGIEQIVPNKSSSCIILQYASESIGDFLNDKEVYCFCASRPVKAAEIQETEPSKRERDASLEERQLKRPKGGFFSEHAQNSPSEPKEPDSGPSLS